MERAGDRLIDDLLELSAEECASSLTTLLTVRLLPPRALDKKCGPLFDGSRVT